MSRARQDALFRRSPPGHIPAGRARGTAFLIPGHGSDRVIGALVRTLWWKGKIFRPESSDLKNRIGPFGVPAIRAKVYLDASWFDGAPAIILDYSGTSLLARMVRDEMREVSPGVYLGVVYWGRRRIAGFMLEFPGVQGDPDDR
jgi:hypothetical protein